MFRSMKINSRAGSKTYRLLNPKYSWIDLWLTLLRYPFVLQLAFLVAFGFDRKEENDGFDWFWNHPKELYEARGVVPTTHRTDGSHTSSSNP